MIILNMSKTCVVANTKSPILLHYSMVLKARDHLKYVKNLRRGKHEIAYFTSLQYGSEGA